MSNNYLIWTNKNCNKSLSIWSSLMPKSCFLTKSARALTARYCTKLECMDIKTRCLFRWKPIHFHWKCPMLLWPWQRPKWSGWCILGRSLIDASTLMIENFQAQRWQFVPLSKFQMWKIDIILVTLKIRSRSKFLHAVKCLVIVHLGYKYHLCTFNSYWFMGISLSHWL